MNKKIPKIFVNNIKKINNNKTVFYSGKENYVNENISYIDINKKINDLFIPNDYSYKKKLHIKTLEEEKDYIIISKNTDYLLTIDGKRIYFNKIIDIHKA